VTSTADQRGLLGSSRAVAASLVVFMACGVLVVLLAARLLQSADYTKFAAFSGLLGVLVLGPAGSLEQASALRGSGQGSEPVRRALVLRAAGAWLLVTVVLLLPLDGWQRRLLGDQAVLAVVAMVVGAPLIMSLAVRRGLAVAREQYGQVAAAHVLAGAGTLLLPFALRLTGLPMLSCFVLGSVLAWLPPYVLLVLAGRQARRDPVAARPSASGTTTWLVVGNLLLLANLLAVPPLLRWHVADIGARAAADLQLLVSVSRLPTTAVLGFLPVILGRLFRSGRPSPLGAPHDALALAAGVGAAAVLGSAVLGNAFVAALTGRTEGLPLGTVVLATSPAVLLCPAIVLMGAAIVRQQYLLVSLAWSSGLVVLAATAAWDLQGTAQPVLVGVLVSAVLPVLVLLRGLSTSPKVRP
jgi:hypothetical protein